MLPSPSALASPFSLFSPRPSRPSSPNSMLNGGTKLLPPPVTLSPIRRRLRTTLFQLTGAFFVLLSLLSFCTLPDPSAFSLSSTFETFQHKASALKHVNQQLSAPGAISNDGDSTTSGRRSREAYVTFLSSVADQNYLIATRLLIYQLLHDPLTSDRTASRDVVVLVTPSIDATVEQILREEGALVNRVDLLDGFPLPKEIEGDENHHWKDQYTKLHIFNMTSYDRVLYLDNDVLLLKSLAPIWTSPGSELESSGLGGIGERKKEELVESDKRLESASKEDERSYLNAGFMMLRPGQERFDVLRHVRDYEPFYMEQALLNRYFDWDGEHPWTLLDPKFVSHFPKAGDIANGYYTLHAKMWKDPVDQAVVDAWQAAMDRMERYWASRREGAD
ncbi:hypothetical protein IAU59_000593 [Kwoniella sp. CBS 9459]